MLATVQQSLRPVRVRWQQQRLVRAATTGLLAASGAAVMAALGRRFGVPLPTGVEWALPLGGALLTTCWQLLWPPRWESVARVVDAQCGLQDRAMTAWVFAHHQPLAGLEKLQVQEAVGRLRQVDPAVVVPWRIPYRLGSAIGLWLVAVILGALPPAAIDAEAKSTLQRDRDVQNQQTAQQLEQSLLRELRRLAELTGTAPPELKQLQALPRDIAARLDQLKRPGQSPPETLATLSQIQAAIAQASRQVGDQAMLADLQDLGQALSAAESLQGVVDSLQQRELERAAEQLAQLDPQRISDLERQTLAEQLKPLVENFRASGDDTLAAAVAPMQQGLAQQDNQLIRDAVDRLAAALKQQALRLAIQAELDAQLGQLSEAKGVSRSGGNNIAPSDESRQTWGQGKAGDPTRGQANQLQTTRQRENLTGVQGEGPTDRQQMRVEATQGDAQRPLQPAFRQYEQAAEEVLRKEPLPLGYRRTLREYFRSIRPE